MHCYQRGYTKNQCNALIFQEKRSSVRDTLVHGLAADTTSLSLVVGASDIVDTMLCCRCGQVVDPLLAFHTSSICLANVPRTGLQVQCVCGDKILALRRLPVGALARIDVHDVHGVNLFETAASSLAEEEVHDNGAEEVAGGEDVAVAIVDGSGDERCEEGDEEVLFFR